MTHSQAELIVASWRAAGADPGNDVAVQADALDDAAKGLSVLLTAFAGQPHRALDAIAVFRGLSKAAESMALAASELQRQEWLDLGDEESREARAAWDAALTGLRTAHDTFKRVAGGWM